MNLPQPLTSLIFSNVLTPLVILITGIAVVYFLWGVAKYIGNAESPDVRADARRHMLWGVIGLGIMLSAYGIAFFVFNSVSSLGGGTGVNNQPVKTPEVLVPGKGF